MAKGKKSTKTKAINILYKSSNKAEKNKKIKIARHQLAHPNDKQEIGLVPSYKRVKPLPTQYGSPPVKNKDMFRKSK